MSLGLFPTIIPQFSGDPGTMQTVELMRQLVYSSYLHPAIRERAATVVQGCGHSNPCEHYQLLDFVRANIQFVRDPFDTEVLSDPVSFIELRLRNGEPAFGDCAQMVTYMAALLKSIGHAPAFKVIGNEAEFDHVFIVCEGMELDPTLSGVNVPIGYDRSFVVPL